jgi:MerR family transcriptional regulator, heat shock protein HspR
VPGTGDRTSDRTTRPGGGQGVYAISVAAELTGIEPHMLRAWENAGLLTPVRSGGGTRRYSPDDLALARHIGDLAEAGVNFPGIARVLDLEQQLQDAQREIERLNARLEQTRRYLGGEPNGKA